MDPEDEEGLVAEVLEAEWWGHRAGEGRWQSYI